MAERCGLELTPALVRVKIGDAGAETPDVIRCAINKGRGEVSKANFQFYWKGSTDIFGPNPTNEKSEVFIWFNGVIVFSQGVVKSSNINPSGRCAGEFTVQVTAEDLMHRLTNKRLTRRQRQNGLSTMAMISSVFKRTYLAYDDPMMVHDIERGASPLEFISHTVNMAEWNQFVKGGEQNTIAQLHPVTKNADQFNTARGSTGEGDGGAFILHDHSKMDTTGPHAGGPSVAVFGQK